MRFLLPGLAAHTVSEYAVNRVRFPTRLLVAMSALTIPPGVAAQTVCSLPVSTYLTDADGVALDGSVDVELRFFLDPLPGAPPAECRTFADVPVADGWLRVDVDACDEPDAVDCGTMPLSEILRDASGLWVDVVVGGTVLGPRIAVGAVPYAVEASNASTLQGREPDAFEAAGTVDAHAAGPDAHHSSTSDGMAITPVSVEVGETLIESGTVDLGPDASDELTAEIVQTLTDGGDADALHTHSSGGHVGGAACYEVWGAGDCAEGFTPVITGSAMSLWSGTIDCVDTTSLTPISTNGMPYSRRFENLGATPAWWQFDATEEEPDLVCSVCCGTPVVGP